jgi:hypothetical protein
MNLHLLIIPLRHILRLYYTREVTCSSVLLNRLQEEIQMHVSPCFHTVMFHPLAIVYVFTFCRRRIFHVFALMMLMMLLSYSFHFRQFLDRNVRIMAACSTHANTFVWRRCDLEGARCPFTFLYSQYRQLSLETLYTLPTCCMCLCHRIVKVNKIISSNTWSL